MKKLRPREENSVTREHPCPLSTSVLCQTPPESWGCGNPTVQVPRAPYVRGPGKGSVPAESSPAPAPPQLEMGGEMEEQLQPLEQRGPSGCCGSLHPRPCCLPTGAQLLLPTEQPRFQGRGRVQCRPRTWCYGHLEMEGQPFQGCGDTSREVLRLIQEGKKAQVTRRPTRTPDAPPPPGAIS